MGLSTMTLEAHEDGSTLGAPSWWLMDGWIIHDMGGSPHRRTKWEPYSLSGFRRACRGADTDDSSLSCWPHPALPTITVEKISWSKLKHYFFKVGCRWSRSLSLPFLTPSLTTDTPHVCILLLLSPVPHHSLKVPTHPHSPVPPPLTSPETSA